MILNILATDSLSRSQVSAILGIIVIISLGGWLLIRWYVRPATASERKEAITLLFQVLGGTALILGAYFTWQQLITSRDELKTSQQGQITERFTRAIDQLGKSDARAEGKANGISPTNLAIRLGGIYALERIAKDSKEDYPAVMEVLAAFVRENASWSADKENPAAPIPRIQADIQAAVNVIGRRVVDYQTDESQPIDLSGADLRGAQLTRANLNRVYFRSTHFEEAVLAGAQFEGAILSDARFAGAVLKSASLRKADMRGCDLRGAVVDQVDFTDANLSGADLSGVDLRNAVGLTSQQLSSAKTDARTIFGR